MELTPDYFYDRVNIDDDGHWRWQLSKTQGGYGKALNTESHRLAYEFFKGPIPPGYQIDHRKGCPRDCCNPDHLTAVSREMNITLIGVRRRGQMHRKALRVSKLLHKEVGKRLQRSFG